MRLMATLCTKRRVVFTGSLVAISVMVTPLLVSARLKFKGVSQVKKVIGLVAREVNTIVRIGGLGWVKLWVGGVMESSTSMNGQNSRLVLVPDPIVCMRLMTSVRFPGLGIEAAVMC